MNNISVSYTHLDVYKRQLIRCRKNRVISKKVLKFKWKTPTKHNNKLLRDIRITYIPAYLYLYVSQYTVKDS